MTDIRESLYQLLSSIKEFAEILAQEEHILRTLDIHHHMLQPLIEKKICIVQSIATYDDHRRKQEKTGSYSPPYADNPSLALLWDRILKQVEITDQRIEKTKFILQLQMERATQIQGILRKNISLKGMYNTDGTQEGLIQNALRAIVV